MASKPAKVLMRMSVLLWAAAIGMMASAGRQIVEFVPPLTHAKENRFATTNTATSEIASPALPPLVAIVS